MEKKRWRVAGVTFKGRQEIIRDLRRDKMDRILKTVHTTYTNEEGVTEPAIEVRDKETDQLVGYIPKEDIPKYKNVIEAKGLFGRFNETEYIELYAFKHKKAN